MRELKDPAFIHNALRDIAPFQSYIPIIGVNWCVFSSFSAKFLFLKFVYILWCFVMDNKKENMQKSVETISTGLEKTAVTISDTLIAVMDKLAGKKSDIKLSFEDLTIETGPMKARLNGAIVLDIVYSSDAESSP